jgi:tetratricopeptide (TPR) repeat protein
VKESYSNRSERGVWPIKRLSIVVCLTLVLDGCNLLPSKPPPPPPEPEEPPVAVSPPCPTLPAKDLERQALGLLDEGKLTAARQVLVCALKLSPGSSKATLLLEQLDADPLTYLGEQYFWYVVKPGETLSKVAQQYLGSSLKFVILARYNDIDVPANVSAGQTIKIPGRKPKPPPPPPPPPADAAALRNRALAMEQQGDLEKAYGLITRAVTEDPSVDTAQADLARIKNALISKMEERAFNQELHGEREKAVDTWREVLKIDPLNIPAQINVKRLAK